MIVLHWQETFDTQSFEMNLQETLTLTYMQKINFISNFFFDILQRHCEELLFCCFG